CRCPFALRYPHQSAAQRPHSGRDRKSTRLNSSHLVISYAVFCLKKKKHNLPLPDLRLARAQPLHRAWHEPETCRDRTGKRCFFLNERGPPETSPLPPPAAFPL